MNHGIRLNPITPELQSPACLPEEVGVFQAREDTISSGRHINPTPATSILTASD
jgi:hypothetical protein